MIYVKFFSSKTLYFFYNSSLGLVIALTLSTALCMDLTTVER